MNGRSRCASATVGISANAFIGAFTGVAAFVELCIGRHEVAALNAAATAVVGVAVNARFAAIFSLAVAVGITSLAGNAADTAGAGRRLCIGQRVVAGILAGTAVSRTRCG